MSVPYRFHREQRLLTVRAPAGTDDDALFDYARRVAMDAEVPPSRDELVDLRAIDASRISTSGLRRLASLFEDTEKGEPSRVAIVAASDLAFGLSRMYQAYRSESLTEIRVFRDLDEACDWLGLASPPGFPEDVG